jgi:uroporphyrin-III C-methyltransferase
MISHEPFASNFGKVYIVGAGPGAPDLLSMRARRALLSADVIVIDQLLPHDFLEQLALNSADKLIDWIGLDRPRRSQDAINQSLVEHARRGKTVVRLKGGDPFVFGRGDDEIRYLAEHGIPWEIIPGPSSCTAVPTMAGYPLTRRGVGRSFAVATARTVGGSFQQSFPRSDSLVVLMGVEVLPSLVSQLRADGWSADTPAAVIERGTLPWERRVAGTLREIATLANAAGVASPALLIVGCAATPLPAAAKRAKILFTGLDPTSFHGLGDLLHWPALATVPDEEGITLIPSVLERLRRHGFKWVIFSSRLAVRSFMAAMARRETDARTLAGTGIIAAGSGVAQCLREHLLHADMIEDNPEALGWLDQVANQTVLAVHGNHVPGEINRRLEEIGARVTHITLHRVVRHPELGRSLPEHDVIYFVSPSAVESYWSTYGASAFRQEVWCLGQAAQAAAEQLGIKAKIVSPLPRTGGIFVGSSTDVRGDD